MINRVINR